jgi:hypothetical protein
MLYYNSPVMARAIELVADEVIQADSNNQPIFIEAKDKVKKEFMRMVDQTNLFELLRPLVVDIVQYGNAGTALSMNEKGIDEIIPKPVKDIRDRIEFNPEEVKEQMKKSSSMIGKLKKIDRLKSLIDIVNNKKDVVSNFRLFHISS